MRLTFYVRGLARNTVYQRMSSVYQRMRPFTVLVEGNIGSGKTTYLEHFRRFEDVTLLAEPVDRWRDVRGWNLLDLMYANPDKWAMPFQSYVSLTMLGMHAARTPTRVKLMERSVYSARYCFVENMIRTGGMHPAMSAVLDAWFRRTLATPDLAVDLIVYLRTAPEVAHRRIKKRARDEERSVPLELLERLHDLHEEWLMRGTSFRRPAPVLVVDGDLDLDSIGEEYERSARSVLRAAVDVVVNSPTKRSSVSKTPSVSKCPKFDRDSRS